MQILRFPVPIHATGDRPPPATPKRNPLAPNHNPPKTYHVILRLHHPLHQFDRTPSLDPGVGVVIKKLNLPIWLLLTSTYTSLCQLILIPPERTQAKLVLQDKLMMSISTCPVVRVERYTKEKMAQNFTMTKEHA